MKDNCKMLLFDLDDTLLNSQKVVTSRTAAAIHKAQDMGILIGYITSRSPRKVKEYLGDLPCQAIAYYSGAKVSINDELVSSNCLPFEDVHKLIIGLIEKHPEYKISAHFEPYRYKNSQIYDLEEWEPLGTFEDVSHTDFQRIIVNSTDLEDIKYFITSDMAIKVSAHGKETIINHKMANKGIAAKTIADYFNIDTESMIAFGDDLSDIDMINICGVGVAMKNSVDQVKFIADYITESNDNDGIAIWLEEYIFKTLGVESAL